MSVTGNGTAINEGTINVTKGTGISVTGAGTTEVTFGETGTITVADDTDNIGIDIAGTGVITVTGANITLAGKGTGVNATLSEGSNFNITTGSIATGVEGATGIAITGTAVENGKLSTATVTTTLGETKGTGVKVDGKANNDITVNLGAADVVATAAAEAPKAVVSKTGVEIVGNVKGGKAVVNVNQKDLQVADGKELVKVTANAGDATINAKQAVGLLGEANLVNVAANTGTLTVNLDADKQSVAAGSLVNVGAITGTTNVNINQDVVLGEGGNIVKAAALGLNGVLNINLNVKDENDSAKALNVEANRTALNLTDIGSSGTASVKNTGNVTIAGTGILVAGNNKTTLTNQGVITVSDVKKEDAANNSHISTGTGVAVNNYGIIKLAINSTDFLTAAGKDTLANLTTEDVAKALKALKVVDANSTGDFFSSIGYIEFKGGETFTSAKALEGNQTVDNLAATLDAQTEKERGFEVQKGKTLTLTSNSETDKLKNVQLNLKGTMTTTGSEGTVVIDNSNSYKQIVIGKDGEIEVAENTALSYSGNILADKNGDKAAITVGKDATLTLSNGTLTVEALPAEKNESGIMVANEAPNRVGIKLVKNAEAFVVLDNSTINADIEGTLTDSNELKETITSKGISAINGTVTNIKDIKVTENGMLNLEQTLK